MTNETSFRLLLVEDNCSDAGLLLKRLSSVPDYKFELMCAENLHDAAELMKATQMDAAILDLNLPDSTGIETLRQLRRIRDDIAFILLSGNEDETIRREVLGEGVQDFIDKSEPPAQLLAKSILYAIERHRAQEQQQKLQKLISANPDAVLVVDADGVIAFVNEATLKLFGRSREDFIGELLGFSVEEGKISEIEVLRGGETRNAEMHVVQIEWNRKPALLASIRDVTEQKKWAERLRQSQKMEALGQLASGIAHDFNNILTVISGNLNLAQHDLPPDHPVQESLTEIRRAATRAVEIARQILTFSRNQETNRKTVNLQPVIDESIRFLHATIPAKIEISSLCDPHLPAISADTTQLHQVLLNLGANAAYAMRGRGGRLEISLTEVTLADDEAALSLGLCAGRYLRLSVSDTGDGIDSQTLQRIFEPFFTTKSIGEGTGLGLAMVHGIMKSHEGAVTVYSELGQGTSFNLYFPVVETEPEVLRSETRKDFRGAGQRILFVDDEEPLVFLAERMLKKLGYKIAGFHQPTEAVAAFRAAPDSFDIVITDMSMPQLDGPELVRQIQSIRADIPIIMSTGYIRPQDNKIASELGVKNIFLKPTAIEHLAEIMHQMIGEAQITQP